MSFEFDTEEDFDFADMFGEDFELPAGTTPEQWKLWLEMVAEDEEESIEMQVLAVQQIAVDTQAPSLVIRDWLAPIEEHISWCA